MRKKNTEDGHPQEMLAETLTKIYADGNNTQHNFFVSLIFFPPFLSLDSWVMAGPEL